MALFRNVNAPGSATPSPVNWDDADTVATVALMDNALANDPAWMQYIRELVGEAEIKGFDARVFPVAMEAGALDIDLDVQALRCQRSAVRRYASSSSRPMFSRNGSGVEDNPSIRHVEVRALPHESGPSSCARGSPHWVLLETKTSRRRNALRSCSRTQNVKPRLSTWSGPTKTERSQVGVTRVPGISSRPIQRRPSSVRTALQFRILYFVLYWRLIRLDFPAAMTLPL